MGLLKKLYKKKEHQNRNSAGSSFFFTKKPQPPPPLPFKLHGRRLKSFNRAGPGLKRLCDHRPSTPAPRSSPAIQARKPIGILCCRFQVPDVKPVYRRRASEGLRPYAPPADDETPVSRQLTFCSLLFILFPFFFLFNI